VTELQARKDDAMNFDEAIRAHAEWKIKLAGYIQKPDQSLKCDTVGKDDQCALGKWICGEGNASFAKLPEFAKLKEAHSRFHRAAGDVIRSADSGKNVTAEIALGASSPYAKASSEVVSSIMAMKARA
jgi:hypothetical protein